MTKIDVKQAVEAASKYLRNLIDADLTNLRLEEVELSEQRGFWLVTLGYDVPSQLSGVDRILATSPSFTRDYKIFEVNAETAEVKSMKIRSLS